MMLEATMISIVFGFTEYTTLPSSIALQTSRTASIVLLLQTVILQIGALKPLYQRREPWYARLRAVKVALLEFSCV